MIQDISPWFGDLSVTYIHAEASARIIAPLQLQQPLKISSDVSAFV
jgi:hypothetical protein